MAHARRLLLDTALCPGCGSPITGHVCGTCRLDLSGESGARLWQSSLDAVAAIEARAVLVTELRRRRKPPRPAFLRAAPSQPAPVTTPPPPSIVPRSRTGAAPTGAHPPPPAPWRVQTVLQVLGVALLAMASLVFLVFSWDVMNVSERSAVIALGTVVVLVLAVWLRRRALVGSAQAVGVLGAVLVVLDAWAVYALGVFPDADPAAYAAVACVVCAVGLGAYGWATGSDRERSPRASCSRSPP